MSEETIFAAALEKKDPAERAAYLEQACAGDADLRRRVEALLEAHAQAGSFLEQPAAGATGEAAPPGELTGPDRPLTEGAGTIIGPYKLLQQIGEGSFGVVYMAEQEYPVRRKVALKIIKPGMDTKEVIARFESERQALAMMDHTNIAHVLDAGATGSGRPYFVMELVRGVPITEFCDKNHMPISKRLELFVGVCHAVQHAHHKGIIHRDIKPSNVMVTLHDGIPVVKVIDFGVAKATAQKLTERTLFTAYGQMVGTPAYMSPEQAEMSGLDIDTRSDIYSLGVLLYELLTGTTPLDSKRLRAASYKEIQRLIGEEEAPRPSTRLSSLRGQATVLAGNRGMDPKRLVQLLRSDLDWIVIKALEKDRNRRYDSPGNFAADVERYLRHDPIEARPPSAAYRLRKLFQRNKAAVVTAGILAASLVLGTAISSWQAVRATRAEHLAERRLDEETKARAEAEAVRDFFVEDMIGWVAPEKKMGRPVTVDQVLDGAERAIGRRFRDQPLTEAAMRLTLGRVYRDLGQYDKAEVHLQLARALFSEHLGPANRRTLETMNVLGNSFWLAGRNDEAARVLEEAVELGREALGPEDPETLWSLHHLATLRFVQGHAEGEKLLRHVLEVRQRVLGDNHRDTMSAKLYLGTLVMVTRGDIEEGARLYEEVVQFSRRVHGQDHPDTLMAEGNLAEYLGVLGQYEEAIRLLEQILERSHRVFGPNHWQRISVATSLAACLACRPDPSPADLARALELSKKGTEISTPDQAPIAWNTTGIVHYRRGDWRAALSALEKAGALTEGFYKCRNDFFLAMTHHKLGNQEKARELYRRAIAWMDEKRTRAPDLLRFRAEAAALLGIKNEPKEGAR